MLPARYSISFDSITNDAKPSVGEIADLIADLKKAGHPIPPGYSITTTAYFDFLRENDLHKKILHILGTIDFSNPHSLEKAAKSIEQLIQNGTLSEAFISEIFALYSRMSGILQDAEVIVSVSLPGLVSSKHVRGEASLLVCIKELWASYFRVEALSEYKDAYPSLLEKGVPLTIRDASTTNTIDHIQDSSITARPQAMTTFPTATRIYTEITNPVLATDLAKCHVDGIGRFPAEYSMLRNGDHPKKTIHEGRRSSYVEKLAHDLANYATAFSPRPLVYQISDLTTADFRQLQGGDLYEQEEENPFLGVRGAARHTRDTDVLALELEGIKMARDTLGAKNIWIMLPFVRTVTELVTMKKLITDAGLYRSATLKIWMTVETPANVILLDSFIEKGIDGIFIDATDLATLILGADQRSFVGALEYTQHNEAVLWAVERSIKIAHKQHVTSSFFGKESLSYDLLEKLITWGITSITVSPHVIDTTRQYVAEIEKRLMS